MEAPRGAAAWKRGAAPRWLRLLRSTNPRAQRAAERERAGSGGSARLRRVEARGGAPRLKLKPRVLVDVARLVAARADVLAGDHVAVAHPRTDHRVHVRVLVDDHLEEGRPREADELLERRGELVPLRDPAGEP